MFQCTYFIVVPVQTIEIIPYLIRTIVYGFHLNQSKQFVCLVGHFLYFTIFRIILNDQRLQDQGKIKNQFVKSILLYGSQCNLSALIIYAFSFDKKCTSQKFTVFMVRGLGQFILSNCSMKSTKSRSCKRSGTMFKSLLFWLAGEVSWLAVEVLSPYQK